MKKIAYFYFNPLSKEKTHLLYTPTKETEKTFKFERSRIAEPEIIFRDRFKGFYGIVFDKSLLNEIEINLKNEVSFYCLEEDFDNILKKALAQLSEKIEREQGVLQEQLINADNFFYDNKQYVCCEKDSNE